MKNEILKNQISVFDLDIDYITPGIKKNREIRLGDKVRFMYSGEMHIGIVKRIYNKGETVNVSWDGKVTAFYYKKVERVD